MQDHRRLLVWQRAHEYAIAIRRATRRFPRSGYGSTQSQLTRAAESIVLNIVEGCGADTPKEFARFLGMSIRSTLEVEEGLELVRDYGALARSTVQELLDEATEIRRMLCGLQRKVRERATPLREAPP